MVTEPDEQRSATGPPVLLRRCQLGEEGPKQWLPVGDVTMSVVLAVDFGSSNTAAAYRDRRGVVHEIRLTTTGSLMPSGVLYRDGQILVGRTALQAAFSAPEAFEPTPKRRLADREILLGGTLVKVPVLVSAVFREVLVRARQVMGSEPDEVVVTHPDQWAAPMQQLLAGAALAGGVDRRRLRMVSEAQAAAWFYAASAPNLGPGARLVVFDFGAGTCDVAVLERQQDGAFAVLASDGVDGLGGQDIDARIHAWVRRQLATLDPVLLAEVDDPRAIATRLTLNDRIRDAKEALSEASSAAIVVAGAAGNRVLHLTRQEFDGLIGADIARAVDLTKRVMASANARRPSSATPTIYLTGGSSHIPLVHARLAELGPLGVLGDPKTVVVRGALRIPRPQPIPARPQAPPQPLLRPPPPQAIQPRVPAPPQPKVTAGPAESKPHKDRNWRRLAGLGAFCVVVAVVIAVVAVGQFRKLNQEHPTPPAPSPTAIVTASKLDGILLSPNEVETIVGATEMSKAIDTNEFGVGYTYSDKRCAGSIYAADPSVYEGSGWTGVKNQVLTEAADSTDENRIWNHWIEQTAVSYSSADLARALRKTSLDDWKTCDGRQVKQTSETETGETETHTWIVGNVVPHDELIAQTNVQKDYTGSWSCQRAMNAVSNVVLDVMVCSDDPGDEAVEIAQEMAAKVAGLG